MLQTMRAGGTEHPEQIVNFFGSTIYASGGVIDREAGALLVEEKGTPDMNVVVNQGRAVVPKADGTMAYPVWLHTADEEVAIASNGSGNPRIDAIVLYIDTAETPDAEVTNVAKIARVAGTPNASPTAPDDSAIQTAVGASNPFIVLAEVRVNSGATEIANDKITDVRENAELTLYNGRVISSISPWVQLTDGATIDIDLNTGNRFYVTVGGNREFRLLNAKAGKTFELRVKQDATGGRTYTMFQSPFNNVLWADGITPTPTPTANKVDKYGFEVLADGSSIDGTVISQNS
jgi:hypothetical protein